MNDSLIYPCLVHLMKILDSKEKVNRKNQEFYHANLILKHFHQAKQIFSQKPQIYKTLIKYYEDRWLSKQTNEVDFSDSCIFLREIRAQNQVKLIQKSQKQRLVCQIIVRILILGVESNLRIEASKKCIEQIIKLCEHLHLCLVFEGFGISQVLVKFIETFSIEFRNLMFYQTLLKIFDSLDNYKIANFIGRTIQKYRQDWNRKQKQIQDKVPVKRLNQPSVQLCSRKQQLSLQQKQTQNKSQQLKTVPKSVNKPTQKQSYKSSFKKVVNNAKIQQSARRRTLFNDNRYKFNSRKSDLFQLQSRQGIPLEETPYLQHGKFRVKNTQYAETFGYVSTQRQFHIQELCFDFLVENTPEKKKKGHNCSKFQSFNLL